jgi:hypothetical protein
MNISLIYISIRKLFIVQWPQDRTVLRCRLNHKAKSFAYYAHASFSCHKWDWALPIESSDRSTVAAFTPCWTGFLPTQSPERQVVKRRRQWEPTSLPNKSLKLSWALSRPSHWTRFHNCNILSKPAWMQQLSQNSDTAGLAGLPTGMPARPTGSALGSVHL